EQERRQAGRVILRSRQRQPCDQGFSACQRGGRAESRQDRARLIEQRGRLLPCCELQFRHRQKGQRPFVRRAAALGERQRGLQVRPGGVELVFDGGEFAEEALGGQHR